MNRRLEFLFHSIRENGLGWVVARFMVEFEFRSGINRVRFRKRHWKARELRRWLKRGIGAEERLFAEWKKKRPSFFFDGILRNAYAGALDAVLGRQGREMLTQKADQICRGDFEYYFHHTHHIGFPPNWHLNPETGQESPSRRHWTRIPMIDETFGELKNVWEASRFASAYVLSRAYWTTGNERYAEAFWRMIESWHEANPPNTGAHWRCGQEMSIRIMAWCFALYAFADSPSTTGNRYLLLLSMIAVQADRISRNTRYARLQQNNHIISEGVGLLTVGLLFPELKQSAKYLSSGKKILEREALSLINEDGSFNQKSNNYHRLMLQDYLYAIRLGQANRLSFSLKMLDRVEKAVDFLIQMLDPLSGTVPNIGGNDGALVLPLNNCGYADFRPVCNAGAFLFHQFRIFENGPWNEDLIWIFGPQDLSRTHLLSPQSRFGAEQGGYYTVRGRNSWAMIRCGTHVTRPIHADALHFDFWLNGQNIAPDPGSYSYLEAPWGHAFMSTGVHNTVEIDHLDQMERGPRFMWTRWLHAKVNRFLENSNEGICFFEGEHDGYTRLSKPVVHRRGVLSLKTEYWILIDDLLGEGRHHCRLNWLFDDVPFRVDDRQAVQLMTKPHPCSFHLWSAEADSQKASLNIFRGSEESAPYGWRSPAYRVRKPCLSLDYSINAALPARFITVITAVDASDQKTTVGSRVVRLENRYEIRLNEPSRSSLSVASVQPQHGSLVTF